jgi:hypothetical protein
MFPLPLRRIDVGNSAFDGFMDSRRTRAVPPGAVVVMVSMEAIMMLDYKISSVVLKELWDICDPTVFIPPQLSARPGTIHPGLRTNNQLQSLPVTSRTPIACAHTTGNSNTNLSQVSYRNLLRSQYKQGCNQCEHSQTQVYHNIKTHQLHLNAPYKHLSMSVSTLPVERTN